MRRGGGGHWVSVASPLLYSPPPDWIMGRKILSWRPSSTVVARDHLRVCRLGRMCGLGPLRPRGCHGFALARGRSTRVRKPASFRDFTSPIPGISRFQGGGPRANLTLTRLEWNRWCVLFLETRSADRRAASDAHPDRGGSLERCGRSARRGLGCVGGWRAWPPVRTSARLRDARRWLEDFPRFDMGLHLIVRAGLRS